MNQRSEKTKEDIQKKIHLDTTEKINTLSYNCSEEKSL